MHSDSNGEKPPSASTRSGVRLKPNLQENNGASVGAAHVASAGLHSLPTENTPKLLQLQNISKRFGDTLANEDISLSLHKGEVVALLGENGAGKTTLMSILFGHYVAEQGTIHYADAQGVLQLLQPGNPQAALAARIGMVHQHFTLAENLTGFENILLGSENLLLPARGRAALRARVEAQMTESGLQVSLDERVSALTVGERQRIEILKALAHDTQVLVLDEPTAVLTPQEAEGLYQTVALLAQRGLAIIFISHKLHEVMAASDRVVVLRHGKLVGELTTAEASQQQIAEMMVGREVPANKHESVERGEPVLQLSKVTVDSAQLRHRLRDVSLTVHSGEIVGVAGVSGNGQAGLADLISGLLQPSSGEMRIGGTPASGAGPRQLMARGVARIPEDRHHQGVVAAMNISENLIIESLDDSRFQRFGVVRSGAARAHAEQQIEEYDIRCEGPDATVGLLSGGNMQKLILARALDKAPLLILASQPARGLDIGAQTDVYQRLLDARKRGAGVLLISEDLDELFSLADRLVVLHEGELIDAGDSDKVDRSSIGLMMAGQHKDVAEPQEAQR